MWNVCGWSLDPAHKLRGNMIKALGLDVICISETFLTKDKCVILDGYTWFGNNRKSISKRAFRGSGGVGILIRNDILQHYNISIISDKFEGILWIQLNNGSGENMLGICCCYLPPSNSSRGDNSQDFFDSLKSLVIEITI